MDVRVSLPPGQQQARNRWNTQESGAAFDRKKLSYLTEEARDFIAQRSFFVMSGLGRHNELDGLLVMGSPGIVQTLDSTSCLLRLDYRPGVSALLDRLSQQSPDEQMAQLGLFFISHATRERLCVQGSAEPLLGTTSKKSPFSASFKSLWVLFHVQQSFFHCAKYIRTKVSGLNVAMTDKHAVQGKDVLRSSQHFLSAELCAFIAQQVLCFICTVDQHGQCAVNHRGGAAGFLTTLPPTPRFPGGQILLPDYAGNGAFEAIGNILETGRSTFIIPSYSAHMALSISGTTSIMEPDELPVDVAQRCIGAERVIALSVQHVTLQHGDWSATLAAERRFTTLLETPAKSAFACSIQSRAGEF